MFSCIICKKSSTKHCPVCYTTYCGEDCQKADWSVNHRNICFDASLLCMDLFAFFMVMSQADRDQIVALAQQNKNAYALGTRFDSLAEARKFTKEGIIEQVNYVADKKMIYTTGPLYGKPYDKNKQIAIFIECAVLGKPGYYSSVAFVMSIDKTKSERQDEFPLILASKDAKLTYL